MSITTTAPVRLSQGLTLDAGEDAAPAVWNVVAYEGEFAGHAMGAFAFTRETFEQIVRNFRDDPRYQARAGMTPVAEATPEQIAAGAYDVVQWDFHHASEMPPTDGNIAAAGAPAQGWVLEVKIGEHQGKCALVALSRFLEPARSYIRAGRYRWCSVSVWFNAPDPVTKENKGATLTSIAVTNNPFLQGLPALRASRDATGQLSLGYYYGSACSEAEAFGYVRSLVGLPETATLADVIAKVTEVRAWIAGGALPAGIDDDAKPADFTSALRSILSLPLLSTPDDVFAHVDQLFARLVAAALGTVPAAPPAVSPTTPSAAVAATIQETQTMTTNATGAPSGAKDATVLPVASALLQAGPDLRNTLAKMVAHQRHCSTDDVTDGHILAMAESGAALQKQIDDLMTALGVKTLAEALAKMSAAEELKSKLAEALSGKAAAEEAMQGYESEMVEEDMGLAMASLGVTDTAAPMAKLARAALVAERGTTAESINAFRKTYKITDLRKAARDEMTKAAHKVVADRSQTEPAHLTASIATDRQTPPATPQNQNAQPEGLTLSLQGNRVVLGGPVSREAPLGSNAQPGAITMATLRERYADQPNDFLRKVAFVKAEHAKNNPGAQALDHVLACERAHGMRLAAA